MTDVVVLDLVFGSTEMIPSQHGTLVGMPSNSDGSSGMIKVETASITYKLSRQADQPNVSDTGVARILRTRVYLPGLDFAELSPCVLSNVPIPNIAHICPPPEHEPKGLPDGLPENSAPTTRCDGDMLT